jgi:hypothetical protein
MSIVSNLYAEKVFAEHPLALWSLDEKVDYLSFITEEQRSISNTWSFSDCTVTEENIDINKPFLESVLNLIEFDNFIETSKEITFIGEDLESFSALNEEYATLTIGSYFYTTSPYIKSISIGFEYIDTSSLENIQALQKFETIPTSEWMFVSHTIEYPQQNSNFRPLIKIEFQNGSTTTDNYQIYINGITVGQWAEEYHTTSLGTLTIPFPTDINLNNIDSCVKANAYGLGTKNGYYLVNNNTLMSKNIGIPMVYGASTVTKIYSNNNNPSLIVPGFGFLNNAGKYKEYTLEMWLKINSDEKTPKRIFGPISSTDGLYVEGGFLTLVVGKYFASHFIGQWYRPMLIQIRVINNSIVMLINGEQVVSLNIDTNSLNLPEEYSAGKSNDWLGFYSYDKINPFEIDCISLYSYSVPEFIAKRRWVYGQAVTSPETINSAYAGTTAYIDYPFANYSANYTYPNFGNWNQGTFDNLSTREISLNSPEYTLPIIYTDNLSLDDLYNDCYNINLSGNKFFTFRPNSVWNDKNTYINVNQSSIIQDEIHAIYMAFEHTDYNANEEILIKFYNDFNDNYFKIITIDGDIKYILNYNGVNTILKTINNYSLNDPISVGISIHEIVNYFGGDTAVFFGSQNNLKFYIAGDGNKDNCFVGKIYSVGISTEYNLSVINSHFDSQGFVNISDAADLIEHTASYTLLPSIAYNTFFLDIGISGYWQDYIPLSYFAKYVDNSIGERYYGLDFLQFNIDYPAPSTSTTTEIIIDPYPQDPEENTHEWDYEDLDVEFDHPIQRQYAQLGNYLFTGWENYEDASQKSIKTNQLDTSGASVKSYISLQYIQDGANRNMQSYSNIELVNQSRIIDFSEISGWSTKLFEVVDNTLIYPPTNVDFNNLAVVTHLDFNVRGVLTKPIAIKKLEYASQTFDSTTFNKIGTRFGLNLYPYKKSGIYYDYKTKNPFSIYKESTPYLYNTKTSGIEIRGEVDPYISRGIGIPINENSVGNYRVSAMQFWMRYDFDRFTYNPIQVLEIEHKQDIIKFFAVANSEIGNRARIFAVNQSTGQEVNGISFYLNGNLVREPVIAVKEWSSIGVSFANSLNFDNYLGAINLNGPMAYNNITQYQATSLQQIQSKTYRPWLRVKNDGISDILWTYWNTNFIWDGVLVLASKDLYAVNPGTVYKTYIGTNKIVIDSSGIDLGFSSDRVRIFSEVLWQSSVDKAV